MNVIPNIISNIVPLPSMLGFLDQAAFWATRPLAIAFVGNDQVVGSAPRHWLTANAARHDLGVAQADAWNRSLEGNF